MWKRLGLSIDGGKSWRDGRWIAPFTAGVFALLGDDPG